MANGVANADRCPACGAMYALVGYRHHCVPRVRAEPVPAAVKVAAPKAAPVAPEFPTYRHRDPEKRRAYMRDYMRRKRAKKSSGAAADGEKRP